MHEFSLLADLMRRIHQVAEREGASAITGLTVRIGALAHISGPHFREHFEHAALGTKAAGARLVIEESADTEEPHAQEIRLLSVEVEGPS